MPDLIQQSTAPAPPPMPPGLPPIPPEDPPLAATPPVIDPAAWEDYPAFRETFLMYFTPPGYAAALRTVGEMLHTMILESYDPWPGWPESSTRTEMRAALANLRHLQGFLASVGREKEVNPRGAAPVGAVPCYRRSMAVRPKRSNDPVKAAHELFLEIIGEAPPQPLPENTPAAVAVRRGAAEGGQKRAATLTPERRREIAANAAQVRWKKKA